MMNERFGILIGLAEEERRQEIARRIGLAGFHSAISVCEHRQDFEFLAMKTAPQAIIFGESFAVPEESLEDTVRRLSVLAPVIVLTHPENQGHLASLAAAREIEIVARAGDFPAIVNAYVERYVRAPRRPGNEFRGAWIDDLPAEFPEILRHEINNPLTGILGNAELLLNQLRGKTPAMALQRIETIIDLAVRLRETIRVLSAEWERRHASVNSF